MATLPALSRSRPADPAAVWLAAALLADPARVRPAFDRFPVLSPTQVQRRLESEYLCGDGPGVGATVRRWSYDLSGGAKDRTVRRLGTRPSHLGDQAASKVIRAWRRKDPARAGLGEVPSHPGHLLPGLTAPHNGALQTTIPVGQDRR